MKKEIAQSTANAAAKSKVVLFGEELIDFVRKNPEQVEKTGEDEWTITKNDKQFVLVVEKNYAKTGRRNFKKNLYRVEGENRRLVQFGVYKKSIIYKLHMLAEGNYCRIGKEKIDMKIVKSLAADIRANKSNYSMDKEDLIGKFNNDDVRIKNTTIKNKAGKDIVVRKLYVNGELATEGCLLNVPMRAFTANQKSKKKSAAEIMAEAEASVEDLI